MAATWRHGIPAFALLAAALSAFGGPDAPPDEVFGPGTFLAVRVDLRNLTAERIAQSARAVLPKGIHELLTPDLAPGLAPFETQFRRKILALGIESVIVVAQNDPAGRGDFVPLLLFPLGGEGKQERLEALRAMVKGFSGATRRVGGWLVIHGKDKPPVFDLLTLRDAPFIEGLGRVPETHDVGIVIVPDEGLGKGIEESLSGFFTLVKKDGAGEQAARRVRELFKADWYGWSVRFGPDPELRMTLRMASPEKATALKGAVDNVLRTMKEEIREEAGPREEIEDPEVRRWLDLDLKMVDTLALQAEGPYLFLHMDVGKMKDFVAPFEARLRAIAEGLAALLEKSAEMEREKKQQEQEGGK